MQFNLVNDQEQVAQFVRRGVAWRGVSVRVFCGGCLKRSVARVFCWAVGACPGRFWAGLVVSSSFAY